MIAAPDLGHDLATREQIFTRNGSGWIDTFALGPHVGQDYGLGLIVLVLVGGSLATDATLAEFGLERLGWSATQDQINVQFLIGIICVVGLPDLANVLLRDLQFDFPASVLIAHAQDGLIRLDFALPKLFEEIRCQDG